MKKIIYISHPSSYDYISELYIPLLKSSISKKFKVFLPHDPSKIFEAIPTDRIIDDCDYFIAEVSMPSLGVGIEIGWANAYGKQVICIYKKNIELSYSVQFIHNAVFIEYGSSEDLIKKLNFYLEQQEYDTYK